jgi:hypothetical protein
MKQKLLTVISLLGIILSGCSVSYKNYNPHKKYSREQLQNDFSLLRNILEKKHPSLYWYMPKDSMDLYFSRFYNAIEDSMTEQQFGWKIIAPLTNKIHCGHTSFYMSKAYNKWAKDKNFASFPLFMRIWNDSMIVTTNLNRKDSILKRGTVITSINGYPGRKIIDSLFYFMPQDGYSSNINYSRLSNNFPGYHRNIFGLSKEYQVEYKNSKGELFNTAVPLFVPGKDTSKKRATTAGTKKPKEPKALRYSGIRNMRVDSSSRTAIITLNSFTTGKIRKFFRQSFSRIKTENINNVILDLRSNGGGKVNLSTLLTKYVSRKPFRIADTCYAVAKSLKPYTKYIKGKGLNNIGLFFFSKKRKDGLYHFGYWERKTFKPKKANHFGGDLYVLTAGQTFSASTLFCNAVKGQPGITLVGEEAGGGWHGNAGIMIPDITLPHTKIRVRLPLFKLVQYHHVAKNGRGVIPDILVNPNYEALMKEFDKKLKVTMELIKSKAIH